MGGGADHRLIGLERTLAGGEHRVLRSGGEPHPGGLDVRAPPRPRLEQDVVAASGQQRPEREHRERVARVPEGAEKQPQRSCAVPATRRRQTICTPPRSVRRATPAEIHHSSRVASKVAPERSAITCSMSNSPPPAILLFTFFVSERSAL